MRRQVNVIANQGGQTIIKTDLQVYKLSDTNLKITVLNMFTEIKGEIENLCRKLEMIFKMKLL